MKQTFKIGALAIVNPLENGFFAKPGTKNTGKVFTFNDSFHKRLVIANDAQVTKWLQSDPDKDRFSRKMGYEFASLAASYCSTDSKYYQSPLLVSALEKRSQRLLSSQAEDGTVNIGNLESPPDTAFLLEPIAAGAYLLLKVGSDRVNIVNREIKKFILKAGNALVTGGVHTPNHRWVVCAALARINLIYPDQKYSTRIEEWLNEEIFIDEDGHFPERSQIYSNVEDESLITIARLLHKPSLLEPVRKNLEMTYYYMESNGDLITTDSRRQDQYSTKNIVSYYLNYRYLAIRDNNKRFAAIATFIENMNGFEEEILNTSLFHFLENSLLRKELPPGNPPPVNYEMLFATSHLLRIRRGETSMTLFGGVDWPIIIASGRSNNPNFFSYRKGNAFLKYIRLSSNFFNMGYFYSEGIKKERNKYILYKKLTVPYYQPLPKNMKNAKGDYTLSPSTDGRFWNKMDFENRPVSNVKTLETRISFSEMKDSIELTFSVTGQVNVPVTIEFCFLEGGKLSGTSGETNGNHFLQSGMGTYEFGNDLIQFGPGTISHKLIHGLEGERYSTHFGNLKTEGMHVYITGITPFNHTLALK